MELVEETDGSSSNDNNDSFISSSGDGRRISDDVSSCEKLLVHGSNILATRSQVFYRQEISS